MLANVFHYGQALFEGFKGLGRNSVVTYPTVLKNLNTQLVMQQAWFTPVAGFHTKQGDVCLFADRLWLPQQSNT